MLEQDPVEVAVVVNHYPQEEEDYPVEVEIREGEEQLLEQGLLDQVESFLGLV